VFSVLFTSCFNNDPNISTSGENIIEKMKIEYKLTNQAFQDTVYVPVYSDIYSQHRQKSILLTATLSIRSTSIEDTTYINDIDYYDTKGKKIRSYIDGGSLMLPPMSSIDYVIERDDIEGGTGANFIVTWGASGNTFPLMQAVMISTSGQNGLSFVTNGVSTKKR